MNLEHMEEKAASLSAVKRQLLEKLLEGKREVASDSQSAPPKLNQHDYPLSFSQGRLWFLYHLHPTIAIYSIISAFRLSGKLNLSALKESLFAIVRRHDAIRASFIEKDGEPRQWIADNIELPLHVVSLAHVPKCQVDGMLLEVCKDEARRPFDLAKETARLFMIEMGESDHVLMLTMHHLASDDWSTGIFWRELSLHYNAACNAQRLLLPELSLQYGDFVAWQRDTMHTASLASQLSYWKARLSDYSPASLPLDYPRKLQQTFAGNKVSVRPAQDLISVIHEFCRLHECTLFQLLLTAFQILLARYSGEEDVAIGTAVSNRDRKEWEPLIGFFTNTVIIRRRVSANLDFIQSVKEVKEIILGANANKDLPFENLIRELYPTRGNGDVSPFQVMFVLQNTYEEALSLQGTSSECLPIDNGTTIFDLTFAVEKSSGGLNFTSQYSTDLFCEDTIRRMMEHYLQLLGGLLLHTGRSVSNVSFLTSEEQSQLEAWNRTKLPHEQTQSSLADLLQEAAGKYASETAIISGQRQLTYGELARRSNQLARYLRRRKVGTEVRVGICLRRSAEMVVGMIGVLKAGGVYVPLDPEYPRERLEFMIEDAGLSLLLSENVLLEKLPDTSKAELVCIDEEWEQIAQESEEQVDSGIHPENLAYVIYTSGSTGRPKGVGIAHCNAVALVLWSREVFDSEELSGVLASTSICFDLSVFEIFVPLCSGGCIILADTVLDLPAISFKEKVKLLNTVPSAAVELLRMGGIPPGLRTVNLAGEPLRSELVDELYGHTGVQRVLDLYGPTEDTTYSTYALRTHKGKQTIGRPITNTQLYVLDDEMQLAPVNVLGEIYIGGQGVSRGYLNRPELTAEKYLPNPHGGAVGERVYRSGDLGRYRPDGNVEYFGRKDQQVKLRGYRIELGEIETVMQQCPGVNQAVVIVREDEAQKRLVAYVTGEGITPEGWRKYLREKLPEYMIPSAYVSLSALPRTPSGKLDRKALPKPCFDVSGGFASAARMSELEEVLAGIWADVLHVSHINLEDDFFHLGGHSLMAMEAIARIRKVFHVDLALRNFLSSPTLQAFAAEVERSLNFGSHSRSGPISRSCSIEGPVSINQEGQLLREWWSAIRGEPAGILNTNLFFEIKGDLNLPALDKALNELIKRHQIFRTCFPALSKKSALELLTAFGSAFADSRLETRIGRIAGLGPKFFKQTIYNSVDPFKTCVVDLASLSDAEQHTEIFRVATAASRTKFDYSKLPLLHATLIRKSANERLLLLVAPHLLLDRWSTQILSKELPALYMAFVREEDPRLPQLQSEYVDFARWQRNHLQGHALTRAVSYWKGRSIEFPLTSVEELPGANAGPLRADQPLGVESASLDPEFCGRLKQFARENRITLYMLFLAVLQILLHLYTRKGRIGIWGYLANRTHPATEGMVGWIANAQLLGVEINSGLKVTEVLEQVREAVLQADAYQEIPFSLVLLTCLPEMEKAHLKHKASGGIAFDMIWNNPHDGPADSSGVQFRPITLFSEVSEIPMNLLAIHGRQQLTLTIRYAGSRLSSTAMHNFLEDFISVLRYVMDTPNACLSQLREVTTQNVNSQASSRTSAEVINSFDQGIQS